MKRWVLLILALMACGVGMSRDGGLAAEVQRISATGQQTVTLPARGDFTTITKNVRNGRAKSSLVGVVGVYRFAPDFWLMPESTQADRMVETLRAPHGPPSAREIVPVGYFYAAASAGGGAYDPASDTHVKQWLKADGNVYVTGTTQATNGQSVTTWAASIGQDAVQNTSGLRPLFVASFQNGLPGVQGDGADDRMQTANLVGGALTQPFTVYLVAKHVGNDTANNYCLDGNDDTRRFSFYRASSDNNYTVYGQDTAVAIGVTDTAAHIFRFEVNGASGNFSIDGGTETTFSGSPGSDSLDGLTLFDYNGGGAGVEGDWIIGEIIVKDNDDDADKVATKAYLRTRWATY